MFSHFYAKVLCNCITYYAYFKNLSLLLWFSIDFILFHMLHNKQNSLSVALFFKEISSALSLLKIINSKSIPTLLKSCILYT